MSASFLHESARSLFPKGERLLHAVFLLQIQTEDKADTASYLRKLEADSRRLQALNLQNPTPESQVHTPSNNGAAADDQDAPALSTEESNMLNPLFDGQPDNIISEPSSEPGFIGEASCTAFSNRLLQCLDDNYTPSTASFSNYLRVLSPPRVDLSYDDFPERMHAKLLLNVARRFIGNYHPLFLEVSFMRELDAVYRRELVPSYLWLAKFYALMSLGETYTNRRRVGNSHRVPGTDYYVLAVSILQEAHEEPTLMQVEVLTLLAWASNIFGRVRTAYCYSGTAMRLALSMGMHRAACSRSHLTPVEKECRRRTWWVLYFFDRFSASKLGQPIMLRDEDIDVEEPSMEGLTEEERAEFLDPAPLVTNIKLARIIGNILTDIYGINPNPNPKGLCIHRVHGILKSLRAWHDELPPQIRIKERGTPRPVASLHLAYNQCIIQTTRPVLLHLFKTQYQLHVDSQPRKPTFSAITLALADSCVNAAQASSRIVESLFLDGSIATFGYWDAHHIFSAALVLIMSAVMKPTTATSEALETLLSILRTMKNDGNIPAVDFCDRLSQVQSRISSLREMGHMDQQQLVFPDTLPLPLSDPERTQRRARESQQTDGKHEMSTSLTTCTIVTDPSVDYGNMDILGNPLIGSFLDENNVPWPDGVFAEDGTLRQFASEIEEQFLFPNVD
ncbi:fungal-specific transcription factor domain-containing protein [Emericellopsis atlantica]|uniref:Fungal-specific transcription factor domain-containing protein n=1 Tax=Emericellopsis atlantica TaxID=2614577 RepID=A0A9P7ZPK3_9HYPO|nr:fungal-specific transcription factor domain-containing protein [Emericellopsis atlantica]KAG9255501.1 fungal-specific transcription factor domain-containing protein [Emericellopsis atlantica]